MIEVLPRKIKHQPIRLSDCEPHVREHYFKRLKWEQERNEHLERLRWEACNRVPGAVYKYLHHTWTHMHPFTEWPEWWREQSSRLEWLHRRYARRTANIVPYPWRSQQWAGPPIDPSVLMWASGALMNSLMMVRSSARGDAPAEVPVSGAYYVDPATGNDANDGFLVSEGGTGPWENWSRLHTAGEAGTFSVTDHIYLRTGTYSPTVEASWTGGGTVLNSNKITVEGYPGETATIDWVAADDSTMVGSNPISSIAAPLVNGGNWRWKNVDTNCYNQCWGTDQSTAPGCEWLGCTRTSPGSRAGGGNLAIITIIDGASDFLIEGCDFEASDLSNGNTCSAVYYINCTDGVIRNNKFLGTNEANPFYNKRTGINVAMTIENNYMEMSNVSKALVMDLIHTDNHLIQNNILVTDSSSNMVNWGTNAQPPPANGNGCYNNDILHNTFHSSHASGAVFQLTDSNSGGIAGTDNVVRDNVFSAMRFSIDQNGSPVYDHQTDSDYNLYDSSVSGELYEGTSSYTLTTWRTNDTRFLNSNHDDSSDVENGIDFASTPVDGDISTFALAGTSNGSGTASDATDMGADVSLVGPAAIGY